MIRGTPLQDWSAARAAAPAVFYWGKDVSEQSVTPAGVGKCRLQQFVANAEALGVVIDFLSRDKPFGEFRVGVLVPAVTEQLVRQWHVCALRGNVLVGYCGWVLITSEMGEQWVNGQAQLKPVSADRADARALTIVRVEEPSMVRPLIRACRQLNPGKRVFIRRDYGGAQGRAKQTSVLNFSLPQPQPGK